MSKHSILEPTTRLRWVRREIPSDKNRSGWVEKVLEQYWTDPLGVSGKGEWRDVPSVTETVTEKQQSVTEPPTLHN